MSLSSPMYTLIFYPPGTAYFRKMWNSSSQILHTVFIYLEKCVCFHSDVIMESFRFLADIKKTPQIDNRFMVHFMMGKAE